MQQARKLIPLSLQGSRLETFCDGDWWESFVLDVQGDRVMIHYVGGDEDEDEWIPKDSTRLRLPQDERPPVHRSSGIVEKKLLSKPDKAKASSRVDELAESGGSSQRPVRRSRLLSDDARLALALQEEELRVSRTKVGGNNVARQNSSSSASRKKTPAMYTQPEESNAAQKAIRTVGSLPSDDVATTPTMAPNPRKLKKPRSEHGNDKKQTDSPFCPSSTKTTTQPSVPAQRRQPTSSSTKADHLTVGGMRVSVVPDETVAVCEALPALQRSRMSLSEEMVVSFIKRHIVDEVCPEKSVSEIDIRTPSGLLLGQDHSLRFIRAILWPPSKGDFVLKYSCSKKSLF